MCLLKEPEAIADSVVGQDMHKVEYPTVVEQELENKRLGQIWPLVYVCLVHLYIFKCLGKNMKNIL